MRGETLRRWGWLAGALVASACGFTGPGQAVNNDGGVDAPLPPAIVNFAADMSTEDEMSGAIQVEVTLSRPATSRITVPYRIVPNAGAEWATPGADFAGDDGTITFEPGESIKGIDLAIVADSLDEDNEKIALELQAPTGDATLGTMTSHTVTISAFFLPRVGFAVATANGNESTTSVNLMLTLDPAPTAEVTVDYTVSGDTESNNSGFDDHNLVAGDFTIPAGTTSIAIPVTVTNDAYDEENEHLVVTLTSSRNAVIDSTKESHDYTINDDDNPPTVTFQTASVTVNQDEASADVTLTAELSGRSEKAISVQFAQNTGVTNAATATADFTYMTTGPLTWAAGATTLTKTITVHVVDDALDEENEIVETTFSNPTNVTIPGGTKSTLTITDTDPEPTVGWVADLGDLGETDANHDHDFEAVLSAASGKTVTVMVTVSGSALYDDPAVGGSPNGWDFTTGANQIPIVFAPGTTSKKVTVTIRGDNVDDGSGNPNREDATLKMSSATNATINTNADDGTFTIVDDD